MKESAATVVERAGRDDDTRSDVRGVAEHIIRTSNPHYISAFHKYLKDPDGYRETFSDEERGAWAAVRLMNQRAALDLSGAVVPSPLDPILQRSRRKTACIHENVVSASSAGIERSVCEDCGNVSLRYEMAAIASELDRGDFSRDADRLAGLRSGVSIGEGGHHHTR